MVDPRTITLDIKGTVRQITESSPTTPIKVVYQGCNPQFANYYTKSGAPRMRRAYVAPENPKTPAQVAQQAKLAAAVVAWHATTPEVRAEYQARADRRKLTVYMTFISEFIKSYIPPIGTIWDAGATSWDSGATLWDI